MSDYDEDMVWISKKEYEELLKSNAFLISLEHAGIDNTDAYSEGYRIFRQDFPEYNKGEA